MTRLFERYFRLDATPDDPGRCLFNTVYFQVIPAGDQLHGCYVGLGPHSNGIVTGTATAFKDPANAVVNGPSAPAARRQSSRVAERREKASRRGE